MCLAWLDLLNADSEQDPTSGGGLLTILISKVIPGGPTRINLGSGRLFGASDKLRGVITYVQIACKRGLRGRGRVNVLGPLGPARSNQPNISGIGM
jgi:hypothetical protein